ncbi:exodeoxyribonuclease I [Haemophilus influenzae PittHH]|nr:exodeoxyribonuclease I [Haemophilus influenzae PittHH]
MKKVAVEFEASLQRLVEEHSDNSEKLSLLQQVYEYGIKLLG